MSTRTTLPTLKVAAVNADVSHSPVLVCGGSPLLDFTGGTIVKGDAYWGRAGSALDLNLTINASGLIVYPEDDRTYDAWVEVTLACAPADAGKLVGFLYGANNMRTEAWVPVRADGTCHAMFFAADQSFKGDAPNARFGIWVETTFLTANATVTQATVFVSQRP